MTLYFIKPITRALRQFDNYSYLEDYYMSITWDGLRKWDVNNVLTEELEDVYYQYRSIVINNSQVCTD